MSIIKSTHSIPTSTIDEIQKNVIDVFFNKENLQSFSKSKGYKIDAAFTGTEFVRLTQSVIAENIKLIHEYILSKPELFAGQTMPDLSGTFGPIITAKMRERCTIESAQGILPLMARWVWGKLFNTSA